jgi:hypothetical protein
MGTFEHRNEQIAHAIRDQPTVIDSLLHFEKPASRADNL